MSLRTLFLDLYRERRLRTNKRTFKTMIASIGATNAQMMPSLEGNQHLYSCAVIVGMMRKEELGEDCIVQVYRDALSTYCTSCPPHLSTDRQDRQMNYRLQTDRTDGQITDYRQTGQMDELQTTDRYDRRMNYRLQTDRTDG